MQEEGTSSQLAHSAPFPLPELPPAVSVGLDDTNPDSFRGLRRVGMTFFDDENGNPLKFSAGSDGDLGHKISDRRDTRGLERDLAS
jgi:hypothetical protein